MTLHSAARVYICKVVIGTLDNETSSAHGIVPTVWSDDGSLTVGNNESITFLKGLGLKLGPGQDAAKVVLRVGT